jgi:hypothetical protein
MAKNNTKFYKESDVVIKVINKYKIRKKFYGNDRPRNNRFYNKRT